MRKLFLLLIPMLLCSCVQKNQEISETDNPNSLIIFTSHRKEVYEPIIKEFQERTGIWVYVKFAGTIELFEKIKDGETADVFFGGGADSHYIYEELLEAYEVLDSDNINPEFISEDNIYTPFSALPIVFTHNTNVLDKPPYSWEELCSQSWKNQIAFADPSVSGSASTALSTMIFALGDSPWQKADIFFANMENSFLESSSLVMDSVSEGYLPLGITLEEYVIREIRKGKNISVIYPTDGTSVVPDAVSLVKNAPHPDNAKQFIDFLLSKDVQRNLFIDTGRRSVRSDIIPPAELIPLSEIKKVNYDFNEAKNFRESILARIVKSE